jgi:hypothetical protein
MTKTMCSRCQNRVRIGNAGEALDYKTGEPHRCREDAYDLPEHKRIHIFIPKTDRFKSPRA